MSNSNELAGYYFHQGTNFYTYKYLGCNRNKDNDSEYYSFRVYAPSAKNVELVSDIFGWDNPIGLNRITKNGVWELILPYDASYEKKAYKFRITSNAGVVNKGDPYARFSRGKDDGASLIYTNDAYEWKDANWLKIRKKTISQKKGSYIPYPINIYEVHLGSFLRREEDNSCLTYREFADILAPYLKHMGYTHIELLPIMEFPFDGSWGYQVCGFYAPTSRFGTPDDFRYFVNKLHSVGIGVILDWVPAHFPKDEWGLYMFDGTPLYEYQGIDRQESRSWGTRFFDLGREEVQSFLISNALYYLREFHIDGLRVDAVASMLYLDYDRNPGEWIPNKDGGNLNLEAVSFFKKLNSAVFSEFPDVLMIAEESTAHGGLTKPVSSGGLGFNMKWNMGFANDFYKYLMTNPLYRKEEHKALTFPIMYAFSENYCLPISHDEVVHGKLSFVDKMYGDYQDKFSQMRAALLLMMSYPGKKLMFMGTEFAQFREWDYENSLEWFMLDYPNHAQMRDYVKALNHFYLSCSPLFENDFTERGFKWILPDEALKNTVAYRRIDCNGNSVIVIINFSGSEQQISIPTNKAVTLTPIFSTYPGIYSDFKVYKSGSGYYSDIKMQKFSGVVLKEKSKNIIVKAKEKEHVL